MDQYQEPKYDVNLNGKIVNRASGEVIPDDEPVMIFRARDKHAFNAIMYYASMCKDVQHQNVVMQRAIQFASFQVNCPEKCKEPDTTLPAA